ncbi:WXG100 family type VII secretion target [Brachybacterium sp. AOP25-B2-12]|uniref:WXG100 family type VII secretion target n=1 Tax=Brachybacterium sp. AOP25-B2-12 TaxID=3457710 RepID=UPI0040338EBE
MKKGMNPEAVDQLAAQEISTGEDITKIYDNTADQLNGLDWTGEDRDRFVSEFESEIGDQTTRVVQRLTELAERAKSNATAQRSASA